jgi:hypothetical protein
MLSSSLEDHHTRLTLLREPDPSTVTFQEAANASFG